MKKIMKLLVCCVMLLTLCACGNNTDHKKTLIDASNKTMSLTHQDVKTRFGVDLGFALDMQINVKAILDNKDVDAMEMSIIIGGNEEKYVYIDGYGYYQAGDVLIKQEITDEKMNESYASYVSYGLDESMIDSVKLVDGVYEVEVKEESIDKLLAEMNELVYGKETVTVSDFAYQAKVNDEGYLTHIYMKAKMSAVIMESTYETPVEINIEFNNIGKTFDVKVPENADEYELK